MLKVEGLSKKLGDFSLRDISFDLSGGEYFVLLGASGVGKSILIETIAGIHDPDAGRITLSGRDITREKIQKRGIGIVFQNGALFPHLSVRGNIAYGLRCEGLGRDEIEKKVVQLARRVGMEKLLDREPGTLSGGEIQRTALARALAREPDCLLLDEPISSLDRGARAEIRALLREMGDDNTAVLHVTHDYEEALSLADRISVMENGTIVQTGEPGEVFARPRSGFVADFVGVRNFYSGELVAGEGELKEFKTDGVSIMVLTGQQPGRGNAIISSSDIIVSTGIPDTSARNVLEARVVDYFPVRPGMEVIADVGGIELAALLTQESFNNLNIEKGGRVFMSFKAAAVDFVRN